MNCPEARQAVKEIITSTRAMELVVKEQIGQIGWLLVEHGHMEQLPHHLLCRMKKKLATYDMHRQEWKQ